MQIMPFLECNSNCILAECKCILVLTILSLGLGTMGIQYVSNHSIVSDVWGQEDEDSGEEDSIEGSAEGSTQGSTEGHLAYIDSQGRFRIGYPADAVITPLKDLPGGVVSIRSPGSQDVTSIDLSITGMEDSNIELEEHASSVLAGLANASIPNFRSIQGPECETYELAGEQACSIIYNGDKKGANAPTLINATIMQLYSLSDSSLYNIAYSAPGVDFNKNLNILRPMLGSFETLDGPEDMPSIPRFHNLTA